MPLCVMLKSALAVVEIRIGGCSEVAAFTFNVISTTDSYLVAFSMTPMGSSEFGLYRFLPTRMDWPFKTSIKGSLSAGAWAIDVYFSI